MAQCRHGPRSIRFPLSKGRRSSGAPRFRLCRRANQFWKPARLALIRRGGRVVTNVERGMRWPQVVSPNERCSLPTAKSCSASAADFEVPPVCRGSLRELQNRKRLWNQKLLLPLAFPKFVNVGPRISTNFEKRATDASTLASTRHTLARCAGDGGKKA